MAKKIFINLPVADLQKAMSFYTSIGFTNNPQFTDQTAACMVLTEEIYVMLLTHSKFKGFTQKEIGNAFTTALVINSLSVDSVEEVNTMIDRALSSGGKETHEPRDYGFMQQRSFQDVDGHLWEVVYMDVTKFPSE
jgi:predicted lactoylglutathione lyase